MPRDTILCFLHILTQKSPRQNVYFFVSMQERKSLQRLCSMATPSPGWTMVPISDMNYILVGPKTWTVVWGVVPTLERLLSYWAFSSMLIHFRSCLPSKPMPVPCMGQISGTCMAQQPAKSISAGMCLLGMHGVSLDWPGHTLLIICCLAPYHQLDS